MVCSLKRAIRIVIVGMAALSSLCLGIIPALGQQPMPVVYLSDINASRFPDVSFSFRGYDPDNHPLTTPNNITILEDGQPVTAPNFTADDSVPLSVIFLVDTGAYAPFAGDAARSTLKNALRQFAKSPYFRDGIDSATVMVHNGDLVADAIKTTQHPTDFSTAIDSLALGNGNSQSQTLQPLVSALNRLLPQSPTAVTAVIYVSRILEPARPNIALAQDVATRALHGNVRIYTLHLFVGANDIGMDSNYIQIMRKLADGSGGKYIVLADSPTGRADLTQVYDQIVGQRVRFNVSFRSHSGNLSEHRVSVVFGGGGATDANTKPYHVNLAPPVVNISSPNNNAVVDRNATRDASGQNWAFDVASTHIVGDVTFPDNLPRAIVSAELRVDNNTLKAITNPGTHLDFPWDISDIKTPGDNPRIVQIVVKDELGMESVPGKINLNIRVSIPEDTVTQTNVTVVKGPCEQDPSSLGCIQDNVTRYLPLFGFILTLILLILTRRQLAFVAGKGIGFVQTQVGEIRKTLLGARSGSHHVLARLLVQEGPENLIGKTIDLYNDTTPVGRDPQRSEINFYKPDTSSSVSGRHCTILHQSSSFSLMDERSANGTKINGRLIEPLQPVPLNDGDAIELGDLARNGVLLKFMLADSIPTGGEEDMGTTLLPDNSVLSAFEPEYDEGETLRDFPVIRPTEDSVPVRGNNASTNNHNNGANKAKSTKKLLDDSDDWQQNL